MVQRRESEMLKALKIFGIYSLADKRVLDIGCGVGGELRNLIRYGAKPENLYGIDLLSERIEKARKISPNINFMCGDASTVFYDDDSFDIVMQFTVFTSILDDLMKRNIAKEMIRVTKPEGIILWYDYHVNNPKNPDVKGVRKKEIYNLFPNCEIYLKRITLAPPLVRTIAPYSYFACYVLEKLRVFNTHYLGFIRKSYE